MDAAERRWKLNHQMTLFGRQGLREQDESTAASMDASEEPDR